MLAGSRPFLHGAGDDGVPRYSFLCAPVLDIEPLGPNTSFIFFICPNSPVMVPFYLVPSPIFRPQEKKSARCCQFESPSDSGFVAQNSACYRPNKTFDWSIVHHAISGNI